jgi:hypothetical protein
MTETVEATARGRLVRVWKATARTVESDATMERVMAAAVVSVLVARERQEVLLGAATGKAPTAEALLVAVVARVVVAQMARAPVKQRP